MCLYLQFGVDTKTSLYMFAPSRRRWNICRQSGSLHNRIGNAKTGVLCQIDRERICLLSCWNSATSVDRRFAVILCTRGSSWFDGAKLALTAFFKSVCSGCPRNRFNASPPFFFFFFFFFFSPLERFALALVVVLLFLLLVFLVVVNENLTSLLSLSLSLSLSLTLVCFNDVFLCNCAFLI